MQTITNTINCVGVMGKGLALEYKKRYPGMFRDYAERCKRRSVHLGVPYVYKLPEGDRQILMFPTKGHWRDPSVLGEILRGMNYLSMHYRDMGITSLAMAALGCTNGGLDWQTVRPYLLSSLKSMDIQSELYAPLN